MNCVKCGQSLSEDSKFCDVCGTRVEASPVTAQANPAAVGAAQAAVQAGPQGVQAAPASVQAAPAQAPAPAKKSSSKKPVIIAVIAVAALAVIAVGVFFAYNMFFKSAAAVTGSPVSYLLVVKGADETKIYGSDNKPAAIDGLSSRTVYSMDGQKVALTMDADENGLGELWYSDGKTSVDVAENVYNYNFSASGSKIAYLSDYDYESSVGTLFVFDIKSGKSEQIADEASTDFVLSPDGKSIAYTADISLDESGYVESYTGYLRIDGGKEEELGENLYVFAIANGGSYVYYVETDSASPDTGDLYIRHGKTDDKIGSIDLYSALYLNNDCSELMFVKNGSTYICADGKDKEKVSDLSLDTLVAPDGTQYSSNNSNTVYSATLGISSFADHLYSFSDQDSEGGATLSYLKKDLSTEDIDDLNDYYYMYNVSLSPNGKALYYINDSGKILHYSDYRNLKADPEKIEADADITYFIVMPDQSAVYYIDSDQTLWVQRGTSDPEEIASDVETYSLNVSKDEKGIYYICDFEAADSSTDEYAGGGTLNYIKNEAKADSVEIADGVYSVEVYDFGTVYYVYDSTDESLGSYVGEAFYSKDNKNFTSIMDDAIFG